MYDIYEGIMEDITSDIIDDIYEINDISYLEKANNQEGTK